jgi:hypothetical protein
MKATLALRCLALLLLASCSTMQPLPEPQSTTYDGRCSFVRVEQVEGSNPQNADVVSLVARYRFDAAAQEQPLELLFQVSRARVQDLSAHLESHPTVLCDPDRVEVPPFEGQPGSLVD